MSVDDRLRAVFESVFGIDATRLTDQDSPHTIEGWDSVNHLNLVLALEAEYGVEFDADEIADLNTVGTIRRRCESDGPQ